MSIPQLSTILEELDGKLDSAGTNVPIQINRLQRIISKLQKIKGKSGRVTYRLVNSRTGPKIRVKRVDLLDADAPLDCIMGYV